MIDFDALYARGRSSARGVSSASTVQPKSTEQSFGDWYWNQLKDNHLAPLRGVVGAVQDVYGLADTLAFDSLPDWSENPLGTSETVTGGFIEGTTNFLTGFIPVAGQIGKLGKVGKIAGLAKSAAKPAGFAAAVGNTTPLGAYVAGAVADFAVFDGNEERLSNLIQDTPLANPVTEWLAADEDDPELLGRIKNVIEGGTIGEGIGVLLGSMLGKALKSQKIYRKALAQGMPKEQAAQQAAQAVEGLDAELAVFKREIKAQPGPKPAKPMEPWELAEVEFEGDPNLRINGKKWNDPNLTLTDWDSWAKSYGVDNFGGDLAPEVVLKNPAKGTEVSIPGGVEGDTFNYIDLVEIHRRRINPNDLDVVDKVKLYNKMARTLTPPAGDDMEVFNRLLFGLLSSRQSLDRNTIQQATMKVRSKEDLERLAKMVPWKAGDKVSESARKTADEIIAVSFGQHPKEPGGLGVAGAQPLSYVAEFAQLFLQAPEFFRKVPGESQISYADRIQSAVGGLGSKTANFGSVWLNPGTAKGMALDRHMVRGRDLVQAMIPNSQRLTEFTSGVVKAWNAQGGVQVEDFDVLMKLVEERVSNKQTGTAKSAEAILTDAMTDLIKPQDLEKMLKRLDAGEQFDPAYVAVLEEARSGNMVPLQHFARRVTAQEYILGSNFIHAAEEARLKGGADVPEDLSIGTFLAQHMNWDMTRGVIEPHEIMFPGFYKLPKAPQALIQRRMIEEADLGLTGTQVKKGKDFLPNKRAIPRDPRELERMVVFQDARKSTSEIVGDYDKYARVADDIPDLWQVEGDAGGGQTLTSAKTDVNSKTGKVPAGFNAADLQPGTINLDIGGGASDLASTELLKKGILNYVWDPFNRVPGHNAQVVKEIKRSPVDTVTIFNVLNVIDSEQARYNTIRRAEDALVPGGKVYIQIYEGNKTGVLKQTGADQVQTNAKTDEFLELVRSVFPDAKVENGLIVGTKSVYGPTETLRTQAKAATGTVGQPISQGFDRINTTYGESAVQARDEKRVKQGIKGRKAAGIVRNKQTFINDVQRYLVQPMQRKQYLADRVREIGHLKTITEVAEDMAGGNSDRLPFAEFMRIEKAAAEQVRAAVRFIGNPKAVKAIDWFIAKTADDLYDDLGFSVEPMKYVADGSFSPIGNLVKVATEAIESGGQFDRTFVHEIWHSFEKFIDPSKMGVILQQYTKERAAWEAKYPEWAKIPWDKRSSEIKDQSYRYESPKEWFAETMADKTMKRFTVEAKLEDLQGAERWFAKMKITMMDMLQSWKLTFGNDVVNQMFHHVMSGKGGFKRKTLLGITHFEDVPLISYKLNPHYLDPADVNPPSHRLLKDLGHSDEQIKQIFKNVEETYARFNEANVDLGVNPRKASRKELFFAELARHDTNLEAWETPDSAKAVLRTYELLHDEVYRDEVGVVPFGEMLEKAKLEAADIANADPDEFFATVLAKAGADRENMSRIYTRLITYKSMAASYGDRLYKLAEAVAGGQDNTENLAKLAKLEDFYYQLVGAVKSITAETGRSLVSNKVKIQMMDIDPAGRLKRDMDITDAAGGADVVRKRAKAIAEAAKSSGAGGVTKVVELRRNSHVNMLLEYWMNSILSGAKTMTVNGLGGAMMSYYRPLEIMMGASFDAFINKNPAAKEVFDRAFLEARGLSKQFKEASKMAKVAWDTKENVLNPYRGISDLPAHQRGAINAKNLKLKEGTKAATFADKMGNFIRIPSGVLGATDEFWKQINYRTVVEAELVMRARKQGLDPKASAAFVATEMDRIIGDGQAYTTKSLEARANKALEAMEAKLGVPLDADKRTEFVKEYVTKNWNENDGKLSEHALAIGEQVTFTQSLESGSLPWRVQNAVNNHWYLRFFLPFVRTPWNIAKYSADRVSANPRAIAQFASLKLRGKALKEGQSTLIRQLTSTDKTVQAEATGRVLASTGAIAAVTLAAAGGVISGRGPSDPEQVAILRQSGWQPYSIRTADGWISYQRLDPFSSILGTVADLMEYAKWADDGDMNLLTEASLGLMVGIANNFTNKTYTTGLQNLVDTLDEPDKRAAKFVQRFAASMVPNILGQSVTSTGDPYMRDVQGIAEAMRAKVPFYADGLPYMRNVLGQKIERPTSFGFGTVPFADAFIPVAYREVSHNEIYKELAETGHGFTPPRAVRNGIDLREFVSGSGQTAYDRWMEHTGQVRVNGMTLETAMLRMFRSAEYRRMPVDPINDELISPRIAKIQQLLSKYQGAAYKTILREYPALRQYEETLTKARVNLKRGVQNIIPETP